MQVAGGFALFIAVCLGSAYLLDLLPTFEKKCVQQCKPKDMEGHMVYLYSAAQTAGMRGRGPKECRCYRPGAYDPFKQ